MLSRKYYVMTAKLLGRVPDEELRTEMANEFAQEFERDNPRFNVLLFHAAIVDEASRQEDS